MKVIFLHELILNSDSIILMLAKFCKHVNAKEAGDNQFLKL